MTNDNTTPMAAKEYDKMINNTIPYYPDFYLQTLDVIEQCNFEKINWLDLGCGTGTQEELALKKIQGSGFVLVGIYKNQVQQNKKNFIV